MTLAHRRRTNEPKGVPEAQSPPSLRQRILDELRRVMKSHRLSVVPEQLTTGDSVVHGVIVADVGGHRFRILEAGGKLTLEQDKGERADAPTWHRVFVFSTIKGAVGAMLDAMKVS